MINTVEKISSKINQICSHMRKALRRGWKLGPGCNLAPRPAKKGLPHYEVAAAVICQNGKFLIAQRLPESALGGLWEFPGGKQEAGETLPRCLQREIQEELGLDIAVGQPIISVWHSYSHCRVTVHAFYCRLLKGRPQSLAVADWRWVTLDEIEAFPFPPVDLKIIAALK